MYSELVYFYTGPPPLKEKKSLLVNIVHVLSLLLYNGFALHNFWMSHWTATWSIKSLFKGLAVPKREFTVVPCTTINLEGMAFQGDVDQRKGEESGWEGGDEDMGSVRETSGSEISPSDDWG
ncbi:hypothetical protein BT96DRAFT_945305 [Gymnopus androsaceus JB14]|uniref:Uncharacterized protein n=1 Tax=Gymnopus androsaceus JB14 TaxID=1447944 RepID=A0A6A4H2F6_9AGAR|nr:hypothetical protein BT96DRAFT_945305 [Gymnopus androsaceus JB14]